MLQPLKAGNKIAIVALARKVNLIDIQWAIQTFDNWGLQVVLGETITATYNIFAGTDAERAADLQTMLDNPEIKAVISARGGYGTTRMLDLVDFSRFKENPKWVIGFSDITALLCHIQTLEIESIHAIMPALFSKIGTEDAIESLRRVLFGEPVFYPLIAPHPLNRNGLGTGQLVGGNVSLLVTIIGTSSDVDYTGKILFIEEVEEYLYSLDRMLVQLKRAGKLALLTGLVVGHMTDMQDNPVPFGRTAYEIIADHTQAYAFPICYGFPTGHEPHNLALVCGREVQLSVTAAGAILAYTYDGI